MKVALLGLGQAGGKIVDAFLEYESRTGTDFVVSALAINTARADFQGLDLVPEDRRVLIGQDRVSGHGVGADNDLAADIAADDVDQITGALDGIPVHELDAFLLVAGLGGGTGSGAGPVIARQLQRTYAVPVYGLGILPASDEGAIYTVNAARSLRSYAPETDALLLFDNEAWRTAGETVQEGYDAINEELVRRFGVLFSAGELGADAGAAQSVVDSSEIINTLDGVSTVGYATSEIDQQGPGLLSRFQEGDEPGVERGRATNRITSLVRQATLGQLTMPCDPAGTGRALVVVSGPPEHLSRKGIERGRTWLEEELGTAEVRGGDYPLPEEDRIAVTVLLSGVTDAERIESLKSAAVDAKEVAETDTREEDSGVDELLEDDELDTLL
ncbi:MAG: tubulin/FtsZ family protein [Halobacteriales archaeon]